MLLDLKVNLHALLEIERRKQDESKENNTRKQYTLIFKRTCTFTGEKRQEEGNEEEDKEKILY